MLPPVWMATNSAPHQRLSCLRCTTCFGWLSTFPLQRGTDFDSTPVWIWQPIFSHKRVTNYGLELTELGVPDAFVHRSSIFVFQLTFGLSGDKKRSEERAELFAVHWSPIVGHISVLACVHDSKYSPSLMIRLF